MQKYTLEMRAFQEAKLVRLNSTMNTQVGAVLTKGRKILACACNHNGTLTFRAKGIHTPIVLSRHAEVMAILQAGIENVGGSTIWVYREMKDGTPALAKPCTKNCMRFIKFVGIKHALYTISEHPYFTEEDLQE